MIKKISKGIISAVIAVLLFSSCGAGSSGRVKNDFAEYKCEYFKFNVSSDWKMDRELSNSQDKNVCVFRENDHGWLFTVDLPDENCDLSLKDSADILIKAHKQVGHIVTDSGETELNGKDAYSISYSKGQDDAYVSCKAYVVIADGKKFVVSVYADTLNLSKALEKAEPMLGSIVFTEKAKRSE